MRKLLLPYFIISYITNWFFHLTFSLIFGKFFFHEFLNILVGNVLNVFIYTLLNFGLIGIISCYLISVLLKKQRVLLLFFLPLLIGADVVFAVWIYNGQGREFILLRLGFQILLFVSLFTFERINNKKDL